MREGRVSLLQGLTPILIMIAVATKVAERRIVTELRVAGATAHDRATSIRLRGPLARIRFKRLLSTSSVKVGPSDRYYLDEPAYAGLQRTRRFRALTALVLMVASVTAAWALGVVKF